MEIYLIRHGRQDSRLCNVDVNLCLEGLTDQEIEEQFGELKREQRKMEADLPYADGECAGDVIRRVMPVLYKIVKRPEERVAVVTHGGVIRCVAAAILGMEPGKYRLLGKDLENCSITEIRYDREMNRFLLERFNDYAHLEAYPELLRNRWGM